MCLCLKNAAQDALRKPLSWRPLGPWESEFAPPAMSFMHPPDPAALLPLPQSHLVKAAVFLLPTLQVLISFLSRQKFGARREMVWQEINRQRVEEDSVEKADAV